MSDLRQQAIEAGSSAIYERTKGLQIRGFLDGREIKHVGTVVLAEDVLSAAEPFIRAQVLHDLAESFQGHDKSEDLALFAMETTARIRALVVQEVVEWLRDRGQGPSRLVALIIEREFGGTDA